MKELALRAQTAFIVYASIQKFINAFFQRPFEGRPILVKNIPNGVRNMKLELKS